MGSRGHVNLTAAPPSQGSQGPGGETRSRRRGAGAENASNPTDPWGRGSDQIKPPSVLFCSVLGSHFPNLQDLHFIHTKTNTGSPLEGSRLP